MRVPKLPLTAMLVVCAGTMSITVAKALSQTAPATAPVLAGIADKNTLRVWVLTAAGKPAAGLSYTLYPIFNGPPIQGTLDADGMGEIPLAAGARYMTFCVTVPGERNACYFQLDQEQRIAAFTLPSRSAIIVRAVDATTGKSISAFDVSVFTGDSPTYASGPRAVAGSVVCNLADYRAGGTVITRFNARIRVEADGYMPATLDNLEWSGEMATAELKLQPTPNLEGSVVDSAGNPMPGVMVSRVVPPFSGGMLPFDPSMNLPTVALLGLPQTSATGTFSVRPAEAPYIVFAVGPTGYAAAQLKAAQAPGQLTLQPYGGIEGQIPEAVLKQARADGAKLEIHVDVPSLPPLPEVPVQSFLVRQIKPDASGKFVIPRLYAYDYTVSVYDTRPAAGGNNAFRGEGLVTAHVTVHSGVTAKAAWGSSGNPVGGQLLLPLKLPSGATFQLTLTQLYPQPGSQTIDITPDAKGIFTFTPPERGGVFTLAAAMLVAGQPPQFVPIDAVTGTTNDLQIAPISVNQTKGDAKQP